MPCLGWERHAQIPKDVNSHIIDCCWVKCIGVYILHTPIHATSEGRKAGLPFIQPRASGECVLRV